LVLSVLSAAMQHGTARRKLAKGRSRLRPDLGPDPAAPIRRLPGRFHESRSCDLAVAGKNSHGVAAFFLQKNGRGADDGIMDLQLNRQQSKHRLGQGEEQAALVVLRF